MKNCAKILLGVMGLVGVMFLGGVAYADEMPQNDAPATVENETVPSDGSSENETTDVSERDEPKPEINGDWEMPEEKMVNGEWSGEVPEKEIVKVEGVQESVEQPEAEPYVAEPQPVNVWVAEPVQDAVIEQELASESANETVNETVNEPAPMEVVAMAMEEDEEEAVRRVEKHDASDLYDTNQIKTMGRAMAIMVAGSVMIALFAALGYSAKRPAREIITKR